MNPKGHSGRKASSWVPHSKNGVLCSKLAYFSDAHCNFPAFLFFLGAIRRLLTLSSWANGLIWLRYWRDACYLQESRVHMLDVVLELPQNMPEKLSQVTFVQGLDITNFPRWEGFSVTRFWTWWDSSVDHHAHLEYCTWSVFDAITFASKYYRWLLITLMLVAAMDYVASTLFW